MGADGIEVFCIGLKAQQGNWGPMAAGASPPRLTLTTNYSDDFTCYVGMPDCTIVTGEVCEGACGYGVGEAATEDDGEVVKRLRCAGGGAYEVKAGLIDAVTGLSGSGPAYGYTIIEALSDGGVAAGLSRDIATRLAAQPA